MKARIEIELLGLEEIELHATRAAAAARELTAALEELGGTMERLGFGPFARGATRAEPGEPPGPVDRTG